MSLLQRLRNSLKSPYSLSSTDDDVTLVIDFRMSEKAFASSDPSAYAIAADEQRKVFIEFIDPLQYNLQKERFIETIPWEGIPENWTVTFTTIVSNLEVWDADHYGANATMPDFIYVMAFRGYETLVSALITSERTCILQASTHRFHGLPTQPYILRDLTETPEEGFRFQNMEIFMINFDFPEEIFGGGPKCGAGGQDGGHNTIVHALERFGTSLEDIETLRFIGSKSVDPVMRINGEEHILRGLLSKPHRGSLRSLEVTALGESFIDNVFLDPTLHAKFRHLKTLVIPHLFRFDDAKLGEEEDLLHLVKNLGIRDFHPDDDLSMLKDVLTRPDVRIKTLQISVVDKATAEDIANSSLSLSHLGVGDSSVFGPLPSMC